jgi:hypothetical protein
LPKLDDQQVPLDKEGIFFSPQKVEILGEMT